MKKKAAYAQKEEEAQENSGTKNSGEFGTNKTAVTTEILSNAPRPEMGFRSF